MQDVIEESNKLLVDRMNDIRRYFPKAIVFRFMEGDVEMFGVSVNGHYGMMGAVRLLRTGPSETFAVLEAWVRLREGEPPFLPDDMVSYKGKDYTVVSNHGKWGILYASHLGGSSLGPVYWADGVTLCCLAQQYIQI